MEETAGYEERFSLGLEDVASYRDFFSVEEWDALESGDWSGLPAEVFAEVPRKTSLTEDDALRMAEALEDYPLVAVSDIGGSVEFGYWLTICDERFDLTYAIESHCDYWDFIGALVDHRRCVALKEVA